MRHREAIPAKSVRRVHRAGRERSKRVRAREHPRQWVHARGIEPAGDNDHLGLKPVERGPNDLVKHCQIGLMPGAGGC